MIVGEHYINSLDRLRRAIGRDDLPLPHLADAVPEGNVKAEAIVDAVCARLAQDVPS